MRGNDSGRQVGLERGKVLLEWGRERNGKWCGELGECGECGEGEDSPFMPRLLTKLADLRPR